MANQGAKQPNWFRRQFNRMLDWRVSIAGMLGCVLTILKGLAILFGAFCSWVQLRGVPLNATWGVLVEEACLDKYWFLACMAAGVLVIWDPGMLLRRRAHDENVMEERSNYAVQGFWGIRAAGIRFKKEARFREAWENFLHAAAVELRAALGLGPDAKIKANLVLAKKPASFVVVARSEPGSPLDIEYRCEEYMVAWQAMRANATKTISKVSAIPGHPKRPYEAVAAVPIAHGGKAFGALTVDSALAGAFKGKEAEIDRLLRPYAAAILLTIRPDADSFSCPDRYDR